LHLRTNWQIVRVCAACCAPGRAPPCVLFLVRRLCARRFVVRKVVRKIARKVVCTTSLQTSRRNQPAQGKILMRSALHNISAPQAAEQFLRGTTLRSLCANGLIYFLNTTQFVPPSSTHTSLPFRRLQGRRINANNSKNKKNNI